MKRYRILIGCLLGIPVLAAGFAALGAVSLLKMLHVPRTVMEDLRGTQLIQLTAKDGTVLKAAWLLPSARPEIIPVSNKWPVSEQRCVLFLHGAGGWRGRSQRMAPAFLSRGYSVLAPDSRGHGESGGDTITYGIQEKFDALAWAHWMRQNGCTKIYGLGESLGASVLIMASGIEPAFTAIAAEGAFADLISEAEYRGAAQFPFPYLISYPLAKLAVLGGNTYTTITYNLNFNQVSPIESIRHSHTPTLLIHGTADTRTPPENSQRLAAANPQYTSLWLVPGATHVAAYSRTPEGFRDHVLAFFAAH
jgi:hypothetical protein